MNKAFNKIERFDGSNPERCLLWLDKMFSMIENHGRNHIEKLLFNSGRSVQKTLYSIGPDLKSCVKSMARHFHSTMRTLAEPSLSRWT